MNWQKCVSQKDKIYYSIYREFEGIFTKNNHIFDNSMQSTLHLNLLYMNIYPIIQFDIHLNLVFYIFCNIVATHTQTGHTGLTFI